MKNKGLYHSSNEHDSCGVGFVANINGEYTHRIIEDGLDMLQNLMHRGAVGSDNKTGDGAGLLLRVPHEFFKKAVDFNLPSRGHYGVAFLFLPRKKEKKEKLLSLLNKIIKKEGGDILGLREVPVNTESLGETAFKSMPDFMQLFVRFPGLDGDALERKLYVVRKTIQNKVFLSDIKSEDFYVSSFSSLTIIYKGLLAGKQLKEFYLDLGNKHFKSPFSLIHQRYSTNTFPSWPLAQPFRHIAHNGEINTLKGNINYMKAREGTLSSKIFKSDIKKLFPIIEEGSSDSAAFDCAFELLLKSGRSAEHVMMMMLPEAFGTAYHMSFARRAFYEYHACFQEPWDGPAAVAFTDGTKIGAALDRNGLRPLRYTVTNKGKIVMASETGVLDIPASDISQKGRLGPGKMLVVDIANKIIKKDAEIKSEVSRRKPYARWLEENKIELKGLHQPPEDFEIEHEALKKNQKLFGYTLEDLNMVIKPMAETGQEPIGSMGDDEQPAAISYKPQLLFRYFKQLFAQVTNPP
ncbi:MAG: glutamate synthase central domain-containing protein, partial [Elusimicrobiota bacterium]